jgi:hypothetical protein
VLATRQPKEAEKPQEKATEKPLAPAD